MENYYSPDQFQNLNNQVARDRFQSTVEPSRRQFQDQVDRTVGDLSRSGVAFGGIGQDRMQDLYRDRFEAESGIASDIASGLSREGLGQAFQRSESELGRQYQGGEAALGRQFGTQQSGLGRQFAGGQAQQQRGYLTGIEGMRRAFGEGEESTERQRQLDSMRLQSYQSGQTSSLDPGTSQRILGGSGQSIGTSQDIDIAQRAAQAGIEPELYEEIRSRIGGAQLQDMSTDPGSYFTSPLQMDEFRTRLARIRAGTYDQGTQQDRQTVMQRFHPDRYDEIYGTLDENQYSPYGTTRDVGPGATRHYGDNPYYEWSQR